MRTPMSGARSPPGVNRTRTDSCGHWSPFTVLSGLLSELSNRNDSSRQTFLIRTDPQLNRHQNFAVDGATSPLQQTIPLVRSIRAMEYDFPGLTEIFFD